MTLIWSFFLVIFGTYRLRQKKEKNKTFVTFYPAVFIVCFKNSNGVYGCSFISFNRAAKLRIWSFVVMVHVIRN